MEAFSVYRLARCWGYGKNQLKWRFTVQLIILNSNSIALCIFYFISFLYYYPFRLWLYDYMEWKKKFVGLYYGVKHKQPYFIVATGKMVKYKWSEYHQEISMCKEFFLLQQPKVKVLFKFINTTTIKTVVIHIVSLTNNISFLIYYKIKVFCLDFSIKLRKFSSIFSHS